MEVKEESILELLQILLGRGGKLASLSNGNVLIVTNALPTLEALDSLKEEKVIQFSTLTEENEQKPIYKSVIGSMLLPKEKKDFIEITILNAKMLKELVEAKRLSRESEIKKLYEQVLGKGTDKELSKEEKKGMGGTKSQQPSSKQEFREVSKEDKSILAKLSGIAEKNFHFIYKKVNEKQEKRMVIKSKLVEPLRYLKEASIIDVGRINDVGKAKQEPVYESFSFEQGQSYTPSV